MIFKTTLVVLSVINLNVFITFAYWRSANNFANYSCFDASEVDDIMTQFGYNSLDISRFKTMGNGITMVMEDWSVPSLVASILLKDFFGFDIELREYYDNAIKIVEEKTDETGKPHTHLELWPGDFSNWDTLASNNKLFSVLNGGNSMSYWALHKNVYDKVKSNLETAGSDLAVLLGWWQSYLNGDVIDAMVADKNPSDYIFPQVTYDGEEDPSWSCRKEYCVNGTMYGEDKCKADSQASQDQCVHLLLWVPSYGSGAEQIIVNQYNFSFVVNFIGPEWLTEVQDQFERILDNNITAIASLWTPSIWLAGGDFVPITLPWDNTISQGERLFKLLPTKLRHLSKFAFDFLGSLTMTNEDQDVVLKAVWDAVGLRESSIIKRDKSCLWLRDSDNYEKYMTWTPELQEFFPKCSNYDDSSLEVLLSLDLDKFSADTHPQFIDSRTGQLIIDQCISEGDLQPLMVIIVQILCFVCMLICIGFAIVMYVNKDQIYQIGNRNFANVIYLIIMCIGAVIGMCYCLFYDSSEELHCYARSAVVQISLVLLFVGLFDTVWKDYTKLSMQSATAIVLFFVVLLVIAWADPYEIEMSVYNADEYSVCSSTTLGLWESTLFSLLTLIFLQSFSRIKKDMHTMRRHSVIKSNQKKEFEFK